MNENKINLLYIIFNLLDDDQCGRILASVQPYLRNKRGATLSARGDNWDESEHPRENNGEFAPKGGGSVKRPRPEPTPSYVRKRFQTLSDELDPDGDFMYESPHADIFDRLFGFDDDDKHKDIPTNAIRRLEPRARRLFDGYEDCGELRKYLEEAKSTKLTNKEGGQTARQVLLEKLLKLENGEEKPGWYFKPTKSGKYMMNDALSNQFDVVEQLKKEEKISSLHSKNQKRYKRYLDIDDEIDHIEEMYGDRDKGVGMKWPKSEDADADRKRYRKLIRERKRLKEQIDWDDVEEENDPE